MEHHIFLSYSRHDTDVMQRVKDRLKDANLVVWTDEGIEVGTRSWKRAIEHAILGTEFLICLLSPDANKSEWVRAELEFAELQNKPIFFVLIRGQEQKTIPFGYATAQWIDAREVSLFDTQIKKLADTLQQKLGLVSEDNSLKNNVNSDNLARLIRLGNVAYYAEKYDEAIRYYTKAIDIDQDNALLLLNRGTSYFENSQYDLALIDLQHAVQCDGGNHLAWRRLASVLKATGKSSKGIKSYIDSIPIQSLARSYFARADCRFEIGDYLGSIDDYTEGINLDHDNQYPEAYNNRGECRFAIQQYHEALSDFEHAREEMKDRDFAEAGKAVTLFALGKHTEAIFLWKTLINSDPKLGAVESLSQRFNWPESMIVQAANLLSAMEND